MEPTPPDSPTLELKTWQIVAFSVVGIILFIALVPVIGRFWNEWNAGVDYFWSYYPATRRLVTGQDVIYSNEGAQTTFWLLIMGLMLLGIISSFPYEIGLGLLVLGSFVGAATMLFIYAPEDRKKPWAVAFALLNLHMFDLLYRAQVDVFVALGVFLGWLGYQKRNSWVLGCAYALMVFVKPPNALGVTVLLLLLTFVTWNWQEFMKSIVFPVVTFAISLIHDPLWVFRYLQNSSLGLGQEAWKTTIWRAQQVLELPLIVPIILVAMAFVAFIWVMKDIFKIEDDDIRIRATIMLILTVTFIATPYSLSYHFITLLIMVFPILFLWKPALGVGLYLLTFLPLLRVFIGVTNTWIDYAFIVALFLSTLIYVKQMAAGEPEANAVIAVG